ncbi:hypothetical protein K0M31_001577, partial [Melipona bicolor]
RLLFRTMPNVYVHRNYQRSSKKKKKSENCQLDSSTTFPWKEQSSGKGEKYLFYQLISKCPSRSDENSFHDDDNYETNSNPSKLPLQRPRNFNYEFFSGQWSETRRNLATFLHKGAKSEREPEEKVRKERGERRA